MKRKFILAKYSVHDYWFYYMQEPNVKPFDNSSDNHFIGGTPGNTTHFNTREEIMPILEHLGIGIYKIIEIFVNDTF